ncbi:MAG: hypothetical protein VYE22_41900 [Myxococcota bacterium]|nr:hypothetical protein [Myxococcota bacterium]
MKTAEEIDSLLWEGLQPGVANPNVDTLPPIRVAAGIIYYRAQEAVAAESHFRAIDGALLSASRPTALGISDEIVAALSEVTARHVKPLSKDIPLVITDDIPPLSKSIPANVIMHPSLLKRVPSRGAAALGSILYGMYPAYRCEFFGDEIGREASFRKKSTKLGDYERSPGPAVRMRFRREKRNLYSRGGKARLMFSYKEVSAIVGHLATDDGFAEIENYEHDVATITHEGEYSAELGSLVKKVPAPDVQDWLYLFLTEGSEAALARLEAMS